MVRREPVSPRRRFRDKPVDDDAIDMAAFGDLMIQFCNDIIYLPEEPADRYVYWMEPYNDPTKNVLQPVNHHNEPFVTIPSTWEPSSCYAST